MIPKILHYVQIGGKTSPLCEKCMETWGSFFPKDTWEYMLWNEDSIKKLNIKNLYFQHALSQNKYAFVADVVRFYALERYGGIYLDLDVEVVRSFDSLLSYDGFLASEEKIRQVYNAAVIGLTKGHQLAKDIVHFYEKEDGKEFFAIPYIVTSLIKHRKYDNLAILPSYSFYPYNPFDCCQSVKQFCYQDVKEGTFAVHHWNQSWLQSKSIPKFGFIQSLVRKIQRKLWWYMSLN